MNNPILVETIRGGCVESVNHGSVVAVDGGGNTIIRVGDIDRPVFPRSAIKAVQALPLIESGAADAYGFGDREIALAAASHSGEATHVECARSMLERAGLDETCLECGGHWSLEAPVMRDQAREHATTPDAICNNCSGKHSGFVCTAVHRGIDPRGYVNPDHAIQETVRRALEDLTGAEHSNAHRGTDGCSIPTYAIPLKASALAFARMVSGESLSPDRAKAASRILTACMNEPFHVAGTERFCTRIMTLGAGRLFAKVGAEGVYGAALPEQGVGIALKIDDGSIRAAEIAIAATFARLLGEMDPLFEDLSALANPVLTNWNGIETGRIRATLPL